MEKLVHSTHSPQKLVIDAEQADQRVDNFLLGALKGVPRSHVYKILRTGQVRVNSRRVSASYRLMSGDLLRCPPIRIAKRASESLSTTHHQVDWMTDNILYEDNELLVFHKPSGMAVHGGSGISLGVIEGLRLLRPKAKYLELVHRLDRGTSGCLMIAKTKKALRTLHDLLRENKIQKTYLTLVSGCWGGGKVSLPLVKNQLCSGERMVQVAPDGKPAVTKFQVKKGFEHYTLLKAMPVTGRTHQIRVHAAYMGYPICGDDKYGNKKTNGLVKSLGLSRLFLHASRLQFTWPDSDKEIKVDCPLSDNLETFLTKLI